MSASSHSPKSPRSAIAALLFAVVAADSSAAEPAAARSGEEIYRQICRGCHMEDGRGAEGAGRYPALTPNPAFDSAAFLAVTILNGRRNMPAFGHTARQEFFFEPTLLSDEEVANVINYVRTHFGNAYSDPITAADVASMPHP